MQQHKPWQLTLSLLAVQLLPGWAWCSAAAWFGFIATCESTGTNIPHAAAQALAADLVTAS